jgi:hypothetical protein
MVVREMSSRSEMICLQIMRDVAQREPNALQVYQLTSTIRYVWHWHTYTSEGAAAADRHVPGDNYPDIIWPRPGHWTAQY